MIEQEAKRSQPMVSEVVDGQRLPFLVAAAAQAPFVQRFPRTITVEKILLDHAMTRQNLLPRTPESQKNTHSNT